MEEIIGSGKLIQRKANASTVLGKHDHLVIEMEEMIKSSRPLLSPGCCIYKVPDHFRKMNEAAYTPRVISMGPFHHGNEKLRTMEKYKVRYLKDFVERAKTNLEKLLSIIKDCEEKICECYAETIEFRNDGDFVKMILLDATFIIEYFLRNMFPRQWTDEDKIVIKPWLTARMQLDFLLLENQLPFFIVEKLYELVLARNTIYPPFIEVTFHYFGFFNTQNKKSNQLQIMHFVDLLRSFYLPPPERILSKRKPDSKVEEIYCATQLAEAGLTFRRSPSNCYLDLKYKDGVLEIPRFTLDNATEIYARNLMALEQCHYPREAYVTTRNMAFIGGESSSQKAVKSPGIIFSQRFILRRVMVAKKWMPKISSVVLPLIDVNNTIWGEFLSAAVRSYRRREKNSKRSYKLPVMVDFVDLNTLQQRNFAPQFWATIHYFRRVNYYVPAFMFAACKSFPTEESPQHLQWLMGSLQNWDFFGSVLPSPRVNSVDYSATDFAAKSSLIFATMSYFAANFFFSQRRTAS